MSAILTQLPNMSTHCSCGVFSRLWDRWNETTFFWLWHQLCEPWALVAWDSSCVLLVWPGLQVSLTHGTSVQLSFFCLPRPTCGHSEKSEIVWLKLLGHPMLRKPMGQLVQETIVPKYLNLVVRVSWYNASLNLGSFIHNINSKPWPLHNGWMGEEAEWVCVYLIHNLVSFGISHISLKPAR